MITETLQAALTRAKMLNDAKLIQLLEIAIEELPPEIRDTTSRYKTRTPEKLPDHMTIIEQKQPLNRFINVWKHKVHCPYCNSIEEIETHSSTPPPTCGSDECMKEHNRQLARERKRKQRAKDKANGTQRRHQ